MAGTGAEGQGPLGGRRGASQGVGRKRRAASLEREGWRGSRFREDSVGGSRRRRQSGGTVPGAGRGAVGRVGQERGPGRVHGRAAGSSDNTGLGMGRRLPRGSRAWEGGGSSAMGQEWGSGTAWRQGARGAVRATSHRGCLAPRLWPTQVAPCPQCRIHSRLQELVRKENVKNLISESYRLHIEVVEFFYVSG